MIEKLRTIGRKANILSVLMVPAISCSLLSTPSLAQEIDPDQLDLMKNFAGEPYFFRDAKFSSAHVDGLWPFNIRSGEISCVRVDNIDMVFFQSARRRSNSEPFMLSSNIVMMLMGRVISPNTLLRNDLDPKTVATDLIRTYHAALKRCGPPYTQ